MSNEKQEQTMKPKCEHCGKPGGRVQLDPYRLELYGEKHRMRLHANCVQERIYEI